MIKQIVRNHLLEINEEKLLNDFGIKLRRRELETIVVVWIEGLRNKQSANILSISEKALEKRIKRIRERFFFEKHIKSFGYFIGIYVKDLSYYEKPNYYCSKNLLLENSLIYQAQEKHTTA
jgi:tRNA 2-selenouridine synthase SelU